MANDTIGSMTAVVTATAGKFSSDIQEINHSLDSVKSHAEGLDLKEAFKLDAVIEGFHAILEAGRAAVEGFFQAFERIGQLKRFADEVGATTQEMQGLRYVAAQFHIDAENLDGALVKMSKNIGELQAGSKEATEVFGRLGLSIGNLEGLSVSEQFAKIGDAIKGLGNNADEVDATLKLFGKGAGELVNVFNAGSAAAEKFKAEAKAVGVVLSDEDVAAAEQAEGAMRQLKIQWEAFVNHLAVEAAPLITSIANQIKQWTTYLTAHAAEVAKTVMEWVEMTAEIGAFVIVAPQVVAAIQTIVAAFEAMATAESIAEAISNPIALAIGLAAAAGAAALIHEQFAKINAGVQDAIANAKKLTEETHKGGKSQVADQAKQEAAAKELEKLMKEGKRIAEAADPMIKFNDTLKDLAKLLDVGAISFDTYRKAAAKAAAEVEKAANSHKKLKEIRESVDSPGLDVHSSEGVRANLSADRFARDLQDQRKGVEEEQLAEQRQHTTLLQSIADAVGSTPAAVAMGDQQQFNVAEF